MPLKLLALLLVAALASACSKTPVRTQTELGELRGYVDDGVEYYLGVPYARPPVDELRWRPPQPAQPWQGTREAQKTPPVCMQFSIITGSVIGNEDCLYLNIWTPSKTPTRPMPVMVWIHGGGFIIGQGAYTAQDWPRLARREDVVVVSMNYRLGIFGFLAHQALTAEDPAHPTSGNYGIEDQTAALRWVRDHISAFGGDPDNVTLFGQSAGGISVCAQLVSPAASGLFHRAAIQSGPCGGPMSSLAAVSELGERAAIDLQCQDASDVLSCLRDKPAADVINTLPPDPTLGFGEGYTFWWPVHDEVTLPYQFMDAFESGRFNQVPIINGATLDEASLLIWLSHNFRFKPLQAGQYMDRLEYLTGSEELAAAVARQYPLENYNSPFDALTASFSDGFFNCMIRSQSQALSRHVPVWAYQFNYAEAPFFIPWADLGAFHAAELQYVMGRPMTLTRRDFKQKEQPMAQSIMDYWARFARNGNPNPPGANSWPAYGGSDKTLLFNLHNSVAQQVHAQPCQFWEELPYLRPVYQ